MKTETHIIVGNAETDRMDVAHHLNDTIKKRTEISQILKIRKVMSNNRKNKDRCLDCLKKKY